MNKQQTEAHTQKVCSLQTPASCQSGVNRTAWWSIFKYIQLPVEKAEQTDGHEKTLSSRTMIRHWMALKKPTYLHSDLG